MRAVSDDGDESASSILLSILKPCNICAFESLPSGIFLGSILNSSKAALNELTLKMSSINPCTRLSNLDGGMLVGLLDAGDAVVVDELLFPSSSSSS